MATVLVVDDKEGIRQTLADIIELSGHTVLSAEDGDSGLSTLLNSKANMVICDYNLPSITGYEFSRKVRTDPKYCGFRDVPIIGYGDFPDSEKEFLSDCYKKGEIAPFAFAPLIDKYCSRKETAVKNH